MKIIKRINKACAYFPCHKGLEDCTFCYCPFYPCRDDNLGNYIYSTKFKKGIWSCQECSWIHRSDTVSRIFCLIRQKKAKKTGIIILCHGSKRKIANSLMHDIINGVKKRLHTDTIEPAYLQFCHPDLTKSVNNLVHKGCGEIIIVPFFLFDGNHVRRDIPMAIKKEKAKYPGVKIIYAKNLSPDARIINILIDRILQAKRGL